MARWLFAMLIGLVVAASCSVPPPGISVSIAGTAVALGPEDRCDDVGGCGIGACPPPIAPLTVVRAAPPIRFDFSVDGGPAEIAVSVWQGETMGVAPIETFVLTADTRSHVASKMTSGRYYLIVTLRWARTFDVGESSRALRVEIVSP